MITLKPLLALRKTSGNDIGKCITFVPFKISLAWFNACEVLISSFSLSQFSNKNPFKADLLAKGCAVIRSHKDWISSVFCLANSINDLPSWISLIEASDKRASLFKGSAASLNILSASKERRVPSPEFNFFLSL